MQWRYRDTVLALAVVGNFSLLGARLLISPVVPAIIASFTVSKSAVGLALTGMWAVYALMQFPSGVLADRFGERTVILAALWLTGLASLLLAAAPSFWLFGLFVVCLGAGTGLFFTVAASLLSTLFEERGRTLGYLTAGGALAGLIAPVAAGFMSVHYDWRVAIALGAVGALPAGVLFAWRVRPVRANGAVSRSPRDEVSRLFALLTQPSVAFTTAIAILTSFTFQSFVSFFPTFLIEYRAVTPARAGVVFGIVFLLSTVAQPIVGTLSDRIGRDAALVGSLLLTVCGLSAMLVGSTPAVIAGAVGLLGVGFSWPGVIQARFMDSFSPAEQNVGFGGVRTVYMLLGSLGNFVTGTLADVAGWGVAYGFAISLLVCAIGALIGNRVRQTGW